MTFSPITHELAWAAGFFDGEGTVLARQRTPKRKELSLSVPQSEMTTLQRFHRAIGGIGRLRGPYTTPIKGRQYLPRYILHVYGHDKVQAVIAMLWPWLCGPKRQAATSAIVEALPFEISRAQRKINPKCKRGHPLAGLGSDVRMDQRKNGRASRVCRHCNRIRDAA